MAANLLFYHTGALGDFLLFAPVLDACLAHPGVKQVCLLGPVERTRGIYPDNPKIEAVSHHENWVRGLFAESLPLETRLRDFLETFDTRVFVSARGGAMGVLLERAHLPGRNVFAAPFPALGQSVRHQHEKILEILEIRALPFAGVPEPWPESLHGLIAVHPGSGSAKKNWPENRWAQLLSHFDPCQVLILAGPAEGSLPLLSRLYPVRRPKDLGGLSRELRACEFFLGQDTGVSHLAGRLGRPGSVRVPVANMGFWTPPWPSLQICPATDGVLDPEPSEWLNALPGGPHGPLKSPPPDCS